MADNKKEEEPGLNLKDKAIKEYGLNLGKAFFDYNYKFLNTPEEKTKVTTVFQEAIVNALEGTHEEKTKGIKALMNSFSIQIEDIKTSIDSIRRNANFARARVSRIGPTPD